MQQRRTFLNNMLGLAVTTAIAPAFISDIFTTNKIKALAFDAFPIFDPRPVFALAEELFPGKGNELSTVWRTKQFDYQWLRSLTHTYKDFWTVTEDALVFAGNSVKVDLTDDKRMKLMNAYLQLKVWPDVIPALTSIKNAGIKIVFLSNMTKKML
ncbi:MAG: hypothetical protein ABI480_16340, partial [Chitinophagaceae bacterium]